MISNYMTLEVEKGGTGATITNAEKKPQHNPQIDSQQEVVNNEEDKVEEESKMLPKKNG